MGDRQTFLTPARQRTVALEGYLSGRGGVALPTALASGLCCAAACWLIRYILLPGWR